MTYSLASGCSYTDPQYVSSFDGTKINWPTWPELLGIDVNVAKSGISNSKMIDYVYDAICTRGNPTSIHLLLTTWDRFSIYEQNVIPGSYLRTPWNDMDKERQEKFYKKWGTMEFILNHTTVDEVLTDNLRKIYLFAMYCVNNNIDLTIAQGCQAWDYTEHVNSQFKVNMALFDRQAVFRKLISNDYFDAMDKLVNDNKINAIGWPFVYELGGECYNDVRDLKIDSISAVDGHPNAEGHKQIARWINQ